MHALANGCSRVQAKPRYFMKRPSLRTKVTQKRHRTFLCDASLTGRQQASCFAGSDMHSFTSTHDASLLSAESNRHAEARLANLPTFSLAVVFCLPPHAAAPLNYTTMRNCADWGRSACATIAFLHVPSLCALQLIRWTSPITTESEIASGGWQSAGKQIRLLSLWLLKPEWA
jgi:hypothetical protein